jgi:hypothetical protein
MNDQMTLPMVLADDAVTVDERAQRIRDLVGVARVCIIEIGRELIKAKEEVGHGKWLPWLDAEFGWSDETARKYMRVAEAFQIPTKLGFAGLTIDATALYALAAPEVSQSVRDAAIERAEAGETITKQEAEAMIARELEIKMRSALDDYAAEEATRTQIAIKDATTQLRDDKKQLAAKLKAIREQAKAQASNPEAIAKFMARAIGIKKLTERHFRLLAQILGRGIAVDNKTFAPESAEEIRERETAIRTASAVVEAMQALAAAPPPDALLVVCYPVQRALIRNRIEGIATWLQQCRGALSIYQDERI